MKKHIYTLLLGICAISLTACTKPLQPNTTYQVETNYQETNNETLNNLQHAIDPFLQDGQQLPYETITYTVKEGNAYIEDNKIFKKENAQEYEPITLEATLDNQSITLTNITLLDPYVAYVITYFTEEEEALKLCYTYNGKYWFKLNEDRVILKPTIGTQRLRDPALVRKTDGTFTLLATQGYNTNAIYAYDTKDIIHFENQRLLQVNKTSQTLPLKESQAWAPEAFYDRLSNSYVMYWSSVDDQGMFFNYTTDFNNFSYPQPLINTNFPVIDGTIVKQENKYTMVLKDERQPMEDHSQLFVATSINSFHDYQTFSNMITGHQSEGPMVLKNLEKEGYFLYYDDYTRSQFKCLYTNDFEQFKHIDLLDIEYLIPLTRPAHSNAIPVTWKELERLFAHYTY